MASKEDIFGFNGPSFLTAVDWGNSYHRQSIAANVVQSVYVLERDRQKNRQGAQALAPPWWEFFNFRLIQMLVDDHDMSIFGAIYEFNFHYPYHSSSGQRSPKYVIAFRGTMIKPNNRAQDLKLDFHCFINDLRDSRHFQIGIESTRNIVSMAGHMSVWLAGHSLGSSLALLIGRLMVQYTGSHLETYLFSPPFISAPLQMIENEAVKFGFRLANSILTAGLAAVGGLKGQENDSFSVLTSWIPYLFINPYDAISAEYIGYFEHREKMEAFGAEKIGKLATKYAVGSTVLRAIGKDPEPAHLIPSAYLTINSSPSPNFRDAHGVEQWWRPDLVLKYKLCQYK